MTKNDMKKDYIWTDNMKIIKISFCGLRREIVIDLRVATREDIKEGMDIVFFEKGGI